MKLQLITMNGQPLADSRDIAKAIEKRHAHLIRDIENYVSVVDQNPTLDSDQYFIPSTYTAGTGKQYKNYLLTKMGCDMVANKMTGEKGILFSAVYVQEFERMKNELQEPEQPSYMIEDPVKRAERWIAEQQERKAIEQQNKQLQPKAEYYDSIINNPGLVTTQQIAKDYGMSAMRLNQKLKELKVQYKQSGQWLLYSKYAAEGYTHSETINIKRSDGRPDVKMNTKWTQKGRLFIYDLLKSEGIVPVIEQNLPTQ